MAASLFVKAVFLRCHPRYNSNDMAVFSQSDLLPPDLLLKGSSFYSAAGLVSNIRLGVKGGHECVIFDFDSNSGDTAHTDTVVAIKALSPKEPTTWLSRGSGLQLERVGHWLFAFEPGRRVDCDKFDSLVSDILNLLEYAKEFPQNI